MYNADRDISQLACININNIAVLPVIALDFGNSLTRHIRKTVNIDSRHHDAHHSTIINLLTFHWRNQLSSIALYSTCGEIVRNKIIGTTSRGSINLGHTMKRRGNKNQIHRHPLRNLLKPEIAKDIY